MPFLGREFNSQADLVRFLNGAASSGWIKAPAPTQQTVADGDKFTIPDGTNIEEFEFDVEGNGAQGAGTAIDISTATTTAAVATAMATAINGVGAGLAVTATAVGEYVQLVNDAVGANDGAITFDTANVFAYQKQDMAGGSAVVAQSAVTNVTYRNSTWFLLYFI